MGVEAPAREFKLEFIPLQQERYFLLCHADRMNTPTVREAVAILQSTAFRQAVNALPGYETDDTGASLPLSEVAPAVLESGSRARTRRAATAAAPRPRIR